MGAALTTERAARVSPRFMARVAGVCQMLEGTASAGGQVVILGGFVVAGDAAATAANILAREPLFWLGFAFSLLGVAFHLAWAFLFYELFKPVSRTVAGLAAFVILVGCALQAVAALLYLAPLLVLRGGSAVSAFSVQQAQALALLFLELNARAYDIYLVFFGLWCVLIGYLIVRSTFMPRIIGVLLALDGLGWVTYLYPPLATAIYPVIAVVAALGEFPLLLWLLVIGVNEQRWKAQAGQAGASIGA
ncbi:MAG TPA: DUF4386 domain-containing protein [Ktedonobacterales bacterium]|nr:DUF4386 domain-containing protein [Ktedonobacterales bacterium]